MSGNNEHFEPNVTLTVAVALKDYISAIAVVLQLPSEVIYWTHSKTCRKYESFTDQMCECEFWGPRIKNISRYIDKICRKTALGVLSSSCIRQLDLLLPT